ncbi:MAG: hypothetical protein ACRCTA_00950, partial [Bacilli bacterium]
MQKFNVRGLPTWYSYVKKGETYEATFEKYWDNPSADWDPVIKVTRPDGEIATYRFYLDDNDGTEFKFTHVATLTGVYSVSIERSN